MPDSGTKLLINVINDVAIYGCCVFAISRMRRHCGASCAGRSSGFQEEATYASACTHAAAAVQLGMVC